MKVYSCRVFCLATILLVSAGVLLTCPGVAAQDKDIAQKNAAVRDFNTAAGLQNNGLYARAIGKWEAFIKKYPNDERLDRVYYSLGVCQLHTKKYADAVRTFQTVLTKHPAFAKADGAQYNLGMARYQTAMASKKAEDYKSAAAAFATVASKYPTSTNAHKALYFQGEALFSAGATAEAVAAYKKLVANYPNSTVLADAYYSLGTAQQELKQDADAAKTFAAFLANKNFERHELADEIRLRLGMALFNQKKYKEAEPHFAAVAKVAKFDSADFALLRQGQCRLETGDVAGAATLFADFLKRFPGSKYKQGAQLAAGKCFYLSEKYDDVRKMLEPLVPKQGNVPAEEAYWLARTLLKTGKPQEALKVLDRAIAGSQTSELAPYLQMARIDALYDIPDRRKETPAAYEEFIKKFPTHALTAQATYMAALSALGEEDYAAARRHAEKFLTNPFNATNKLAPAVMYIAAEGHLLAAQAGQPGGDVAKAEGFYRRLVEKHPDHARAPRAHLRIGWCLHQDKKYADAAKYLGGIVGKLGDPAYKAEAQLLIGHSLSAANQHKEAVAAYEAALKADPKWPRNDEVLLALAASLRSLKDAGAAQRLKQLVKDFPTSKSADQALFQLAEMAQERGVPDEAITYYTEVVTKFPQSDLAPAANYGLASSLFAKKEYDKALEALGKLLAAGGDKALLSRGRYLRGLIHQRQKKYEPAAADLAAFLADNPASDEAADARYGLVICRIHLNQFDEAAKAMDELVKSNPQYAHIDRMYYELAHALLANDKQKEAADAFRALAEKRPQSPLAPESSFRVGRYHETLAEKAGDDDTKKAEIAKAAEAYAAGLKGAKDAELREKLQYKAGDVQFRQEKYEEAAATLQNQIAQHPSGALAGPGRYLAAESLFKLKQYDKALPLFAKVADDKVEKYQAHSLYRAGDCAAKTANWPESEKRYRELIDRFPDFEHVSDARYGLGVALQKQNKLDEARTAFEKVTTETETETAAKARYMIGEIAFGQDKYEDAIEQFLMVAVGYAYPDWQAKAQYETGQCFSQLGQKDKAIAAFKKLVDKFPDHPHAAAAKKRLKELEKP